MIKEIVFPQKAAATKRHEYQWHYMFVKKYAELNGIRVTVSGPTAQVFCTQHVHFSMLIDGQQVIVDYSDHEAMAGSYPDLPYLKFHYNHKLHGHLANVYPIGPMLDIPTLDGYRAFFDMIKKPIYTCSGDRIVNKQLARFGAKIRRSHVQHVLRNNFGSNADLRYESKNQHGFWEVHKDCLVAVCVPGARNDMLDRGHYEQLAMGVCVISPYINTALPYGKMLEDGVHFVQCKDDYSDLVELINWCAQNREKCREIGDNAKALFAENCLPKPYWDWVSQCLVEHQNKVTA